MLVFKDAVLLLESSERVFTGLIFEVRFALLITQAVLLDISPLKDMVLGLSLRIKL